MGSWADFFVAELGAAAALTGLIIVGISINVSRILSHPGLPGRAMETLVSPTGVLVVSSVALVPLQPGWALGLEFLLIGAAMTLIQAIIQIKAARLDHSGRIPLWPRVIMSLLSSLPFVAAGLLLLLQIPGALYGVVPGVVVSLIATVINAWVLLVEILR